MTLTSAEGKKLECFKWMPNNSFSTIKIWPVFDLTQACVYVHNKYIINV